MKQNIYEEYLTKIQDYFDGERKCSGLAKWLLEKTLSK